jgi:hypothetical protein
MWAAVAGALLGLNLTANRHYATPQVWALLAVLVGLAPPLIATAGRIGQRAQARAARRLSGTGSLRRPASFAVEPREERLLVTTPFAEPGAVEENRP